MGVCVGWATSEFTLVESHINDSSEQVGEVGFDEARNRLA